MLPIYWFFHSLPFSRALVLDIVKSNATHQPRAIARRLDARVRLCFDRA